MERPLRHFDSPPAVARKSSAIKQHGEGEEAGEQPADHSEAA